MVLLSKAALLFTLCVSLLFAQSPVLSPPVAITYLGGDVRFICTKKAPSMQIAWNGGPFIPSSNSSFHNNHKNFTELNIGVPDVTLNNTEVTCVARDPSEPSKLYHSNPSKIVIQGFLSEIAIKVNRYDLCTVHVSWDHPFTQPGVPILGYKINITELDTNNTESHFTNDTTLNISLGYDYIVSIAGVNIVGEGNKTVVFVNSTELANDKLNVTHIDVYRERYSTWKVDAVVKSEHFCQNSTLSYKICKKTNNTVCSSTNNITQNQLSNNETILSALVFVPENQHYDITVINEIGKYFLSSSGIDMSTYDIQSVDERNSTNGSICFEINYVKGGIATGCHVLMNCESDIPLAFDIDGYSNQYRFWCSPIPFYGIKTCSIKAYDKVYEVVESKSDPAVQFNITVTGHVVITTQTSIPTSVSDPNIPLIVSSVVSTFVITTIIILFIIFTFWYLKNNRDRLSEPIIHSNTIVPQHNAIAPQHNAIVPKHNAIAPQHNTIQSTQNTTEMPDEVIEDNNSVASMSAIKTKITDEQQQKEETKM